MTETQTKEKKREVLHCQAKQVITNVINYFEMEKNNRKYSCPVDQVIKRASFATGYSVSTIRRIKKERLKTGIRIPKKTRIARNKILLSDFDFCTLRNIIHSFYTVNREIPTLKMILKAAKEQLNSASFNVSSNETLRKLMKNKLGFEYKKVLKGQQVLLERQNVKIRRSKYLSRLRRNDQLGAYRKPVIYLDACWIHPNYSDAMQDKAAKERDHINKPWILLHAGGESGFIEGAKLLHKCKSKSGVYHNEMDKETFLKWLCKKLVPKLPKNSIVVLDNGPYCNALKEKTPNPNSKMSDIIKWLQNRKIAFEETMLKSELYDLVKQNKPKKVYIIDNILEAAGHEVLHLPPYNCDLNPTKYIWILLKQRLTEIGECQAQTQVTEQLINEAIKSITVEDWSRQFHLVKRLESDYWERELILEEQSELMNQIYETESEDSDESSDENSALYGFVTTVYGLSKESGNSDDEDSDNNVQLDAVMKDA